MLRIVYVACGTCGAEVDAVEADDSGPAPAVTDVMAALGMEQAEARKLVAKRNPGAELSSVEGQDLLVKQILDRKVPGRGAETYVCPEGHDGDLVSSTTRPMPPVSMVVRTPAPTEDNTDSETGK